VLVLGAILPRIRRSRSAGANVIDRIAEMSITNGLRVGERLEERPACPVSVKTGRKATAMMSSEKKIAGVTSLAASASSLWPVGVGRRVLELLVRRLDHDDLGVDGGADGDGDAARLMIVDGMSSRTHRE
jgi:hypothetical protein